MTVPARKRCLLCGQEGRPDHANDFIHRSCARLDRVTIACAGCGQRVDHAPSDPDVREFFARAKIPAIPRAGLVIIPDSCPLCPQGATVGDYRFFSVAAD